MKPNWRGRWAPGSFGHRHRPGDADLGDGDGLRSRYGARHHVGFELRSETCQKRQVVRGLLRDGNETLDRQQVTSAKGR